MTNVTASNSLRQVITYQEAFLARLQNIMPITHGANTRFIDFAKENANLGDTVSFKLPTRIRSVNSLVAQFQPAKQRIQYLTCNNPFSASVEFTAEQLLFNDVKVFMEDIGKAAALQLATDIESFVAQLARTNTYRFYGDGITPINTPVQLNSAVTLYKNYGAVPGDVKCYIPDTAYPAIANAMQNQFVPDRNEKVAHSWMLGDFGDAKWHKSNLLPIHYAGTVGNSGLILQVSGWTNNGPNGAIDTLTLTSASATPITANDVNCIKQYDKMQFLDSPTGVYSPLRYLTFTGYKPSDNHVQFQATANATSSSGNTVTVSINPFLQVIPDSNQNLNQAITTGMLVQVMPSHRVGLIYSGGALMVALPPLPMQSPFDCSNKIDPDTGVSIRLTHGTILGQNITGLIWDCLAGCTGVYEYFMAILFPII
jgi:hypothetical protein